MRYRFSARDVVFGLLLVALLAAGFWAMAVAPTEIPLHYNAAGEPDRWGPPSASNVLVMPLLLAFITYPPIRLFDLHCLRYKPEVYGMATNLGGGFGLVTAGVGFHLQLAPLLPVKPHPGVVIALLGVVFIYPGWLCWVTPAERIPMNLGFAAESPASRRALARALAISFCLSGLVTVPTSFLPGNWSLLSLGALTLGPVVGLIAGLATLPSGVKK